MSHKIGMSEHEGTFTASPSTDRACPKCKSPMTRRTWESSCGGYEDNKYTCSNTSCGHVYWIEGIDS